MSQLILNARTIELPEDDRPLLAFLREGKGLTAAKPACNGGDCGACLVLLGEVVPELAPGASEARYCAVNSCLLSTDRVAGTQLITAEGLSSGPLTPVQRALAEEGGIQCGYCTPGLVVALTAALLNGDPLLSAVSGNLCRCGAYAGVRRACARIARDFAQRPHSLREAAALGLLLPEVAAAGEQLAAFAAQATVGTGLAEKLQQLDALNRLELGGLVVAGESDWSLQHAHRADQAKRALAAPHALQLHRVTELRRIRADADGLHIGAAVSVAELRSSPLIAADWPELPSFLEFFASPAIRNVATIGGNLVNASPIADLAVILLALDAELSIVSLAGCRRIPLSGFYLAYHRTGLAADEVLSEVHVPPAGGRQLRYRKVARREHDDIASVNLALAVGHASSGYFGEVSLAAGGVGPYPLRLPRAAAALCGRPVCAATLREALSLIDEEIAPIDDLRGSAAYKRRLLKHLLLDQVAALHPDFAWEECLS